MDFSSNPIATASIQQPIEASQTRQTEPRSEKVSVEKSERQSSAEDWEPYHKLRGETQMGIISTSNMMRAMYTGVQAQLLQEAPDLMNKDWDFSVDEAGELVILEGKDALTKSEINQLTDVLEQHGIKDMMNQLADNVIGHGMAARGPEEFAHSDDKFASFDVNRENFKDIVFGRELMLGMKISPETKLTNEQTMQYALKAGLVGGGGSEKERHLRAMEAYNIGKKTPSELIVSQVMTRAESRF